MSAFPELGDKWPELQLNPNCGRVRFPADWNSGANWWRSLTDHDLWFIWAGRGTMEIDGHPLALRPGSCVWMQPGRSYITTHDPAHPLGVNYFHFDQLRSTARPRPASFPPPLSHTVVRHFDFADTLMQRILTLRTEPAGANSANRLFAALLQEIVREAHHSPPPPNPALPVEHVERMHAAAARLRENLAAAPSVAELARSSGYSVSHFSRIFAAVHGTRPQEFTIAARLERARELLATTDLTIGEVAAAVGVPDLFYFSRLFKRRMSIAPSEFRRNALVSGG